MLSQIKYMPDHARVWVYQLNRQLNDGELEILSTKINSFLEEWASHGRNLTAASAFFNNRFLIVSVDESMANASGCSIDSMVHFLKKLQSQTGLDFFDRGAIVYLNEDELTSMPLNDFKEAVISGKIAPETRMFNTVIQTKGELANQFEIAVKDSWVMQFV